MFTIVLPIRDTDAEREMMHASLPAATSLKPGEILIALDAPAATSLIEEILTIARNNDAEHLIRIVQVEKTSDWNFHLAKILWHVYALAKYDKIYSFDVDSVPTKNVLKGLNQIGKDGVAVYSFTKQLRLTNLSDFIRYCFYRYRVLTTDYVFSGNYWIDRKAFYDIVDEHEYREIYNGVDTYLTEKLIKDGKYKIVTSKKIGVKAMTPQNEDYPWRQFQMGVWLGANVDRWATLKEWRRKKRDFAKLKTKPQLLLNVPLIFMKWLSIVLLDNPVAYVYLKAFIYQHPYLLKGYRWALKHRDSEIVQLAHSMTEYEWGYQGAKYVRQIEGIEIKGTGAT